MWGKLQTREVGKGAQLQIRQGAEDRAAVWPGETAAQFPACSALAATPGPHAAAPGTMPRHADGLGQPCSSSHSQVQTGPCAMGASWLLSGDLPLLLPMAALSPDAGLSSLGHLKEEAVIRQLQHPATL